jgi:hypothetical protein
MVTNSDADQALPPQLPALLPAEPVAPPLPRRERALLPESSDFLEGDEPAADKVEAFLAKALDTIAANPEDTAHALVPWISDVLLSNHSIKAYGRDFLDFVQHMKAQGVDPLQVTADHVKLYKRALLEAGNPARYWPMSNAPASATTPGGRSSGR